MANENTNGAAGAPDRSDAELKALKAQVADLKKQLKDVQSSKGPSAPEGDYAFFGGEFHKIIGDFRADNTFAEVKRGHCPEGVTLLAIARSH